MGREQVLRTGNHLRWAVALVIAMLGVGVLPARAQINKWTSLGLFGGFIKRLKSILRIRARYMRLPLIEFSKPPMARQAGF